MATILIVEDEPDLRADLAEELEAQGYRVIQSSDGIDGLHRIVADRPDLVLCDISMPGLSGFDVVSRLRDDHPQCSDIPVVFLSALADRQDVIAGMHWGADDYLTKPVDFDHLQAMIAGRLRQVSRLQARHHEERSALERSMLDMLRRHRALSLKVLSGTLNALSAPTFLLGDDSRIVLANEAAETLLARNGPLVATNGRLRPRQAANARALRAVIADACSGGVARDGTALRLTDEESDLPLLAVAVPLDVGEQPPAGDEPVPRCVLFAVDPSARELLRIDHFVEAHDLTAAESRVLQSIIRGQALSEIAQQSGVSRSTVATQLASIFQKTNVNRQSELVAVTLLSSMWR